ncbi:hypothetical protein AN958_05664 [Leucoagaricus sp. SymC.cos]|nr:hypothetical protein AN958_05664 [Leucoagaricus sp. SymC.cos]
MRFSLPTAISLAIFSLFPSSLASDDIEGGILLAKTDRTAVPATLLKPFIQGNPLKDTSGDELQKREPTIIEGLLHIRQSCPSGYGLCNNGRCCPLGGKCCTQGCCNPGYWCYSTGCCSLSEIGCEQVSCCPVGSNCCKGGGCCKASEYCVVSSSAKGCCPIGQVCTGTPGSTCYRDSAGAPRCRSGSTSNGGGGGGGGGGGDGGGGDNRSTTTTPRSTPTTPPQIPDITTTPTTNSSSTSSAATTAQSSPSPTPGLGQSVITYSVTDTRISWSGTGWVSGSSSCTASARRTTTAMQSFTLMVSSAARIFLNLDCLNVVYDVYVNGRVDTLVSDQFDVTESCSYKELSLVGVTTNINVTVVVIGLPVNGKRQSPNWEFQLNEILVIDSQTSTSGALAPGQTGSGASGLEASWFYGLVTVLLAGFGLAL